MLKQNKTIYIFFLSIFILNLKISFGQNVDSTIYSKINIKNIMVGFDFFTGNVTVKNRGFSITGLIINPTIYQIAIVGLDPETYATYSISGFQNKTDALASITGGFRSSQNLPLGLVIENYQMQNRVAKNPKTITGILTISKTQIEIIKYRDFNESNKYQYALQSGPIIVEKNGKNGILPSTLETKDRFSRSFIAIQKNGNIILAVTSGVYLYDLAEFLRNTSKQGLNCNVALNLEGGGGQGLVVQTPQFQETIGNIKIKRPNAIIVKPIKNEKQESKKSKGYKGFKGFKKW